jgi:hypothetical protein
VITKHIDPFETWTPWFAWRRVWLDNTTSVWWEPVERRRKMFGHDAVWEYRLPQHR